MKRLASIAALLLACASRPSFDTFPKIDAHVHIETENPTFAALAQQHGFRLVTLVTGSSSRQDIERQAAFARSQHRRFPQTVYYSTSFSMEEWDREDWPLRTIEQLQRGFADGAVAVKVWKDIGMIFRDAEGRFIMIDHPRFDPVFRFIAQQGKPVVGHLGEPRNCWLPLEEMTVRNDSSYFSEHPQYHMYLHPDYPSYEQHIAARDSLLAKNPDLRFIGAHLGSLEWSVDELAARLDRFPNMAVDMAARICHFQAQDRDKVRAFFIQYQDRLLYSTDLSAYDHTGNFEHHLNTWRSDWRWFTEAGMMTSPIVRRPFRGLALPTSVLKKIYHDNAVRWLGLEAFERHHAAGRSSEGGVQ